MIGSVPLAFPPLSCSPFHHHRTCFACYLQAARSPVPPVFNRPSSPVPPL